MYAAANLRLTLALADATFDALSALKILVFNHNHRLMIADPKTQAWLRGEGHEPRRNKNAIRLSCMDKLNPMLGGSSAANCCDASEENRIAALPAMRRAVAELTKRLQTAGVLN